MTTHQAAELNLYLVILAWNQLTETLQCLESIQSLNHPPEHILLVDNGSTDETVSTVLQGYPGVTIIRSEENLGVSGGYNLGMDYALKQGADYVLIMNNDVVMAPDFLDQLLEVARLRPDIGIVQPKIYHYYGDQTRLWIVGARWRPFPPAIKMVGAGQKDGPPFDHVQELEYAPSCALLISTEAIKKAGMFDEVYFFYFDDWDYCIRVRQAGFKIYFAPGAKLWHKVSVSTAKSDRASRWWYIYGRSTVRFHATYQSLWLVCLVNLWFIIREVLKGKFKRIVPYLFGVIGGHAARLGWVPVQIANPTITIHNGTRANL